MANIRIRSEERDEDRSEFGIFVSKLEGESGEDVMEVPAVFKVA